ncbi:hypothetical protein EYF80_022086 [Liparis tanakae]|uniref:Secreted protein n=1 Tax=Liparis tanakae TaxID=230148 RepID=A0A4Z2HQB4_9TELE|nr:hypothetical protein EYF80_022086 [Liparis tanakae]
MYSQATFRVSISSVVMLLVKLTLQVISGSEPEQRPGAVQVSVVCRPSVRGGISTEGFWTEGPISATKSPASCRRQLGTTRERRGQHRVKKYNAGFSRTTSCLGLPFSLGGRSHMIRLGLDCPLMQGDTPSPGIHFKTTSFVKVMPEAKCGCE